MSEIFCFEAVEVCILYFFLEGFDVLLDISGVEMKGHFVISREIIGGICTRAV